MPTVRIPSPLRKLTGGETAVVVEGDDVRTVLANLEVAHPGVGDRILDGSGELRRFVNVFVRDEDVRAQQGLETPVDPSDTVSIVPAVAGGAD
ncbi:ubiquitin-like small modifier protein 1 [Nitriliruptor alkaliphilus]|uniref:ubiquitin-like small modifier protein 1 n=1 Tax=Nitriliruptor alkaliphilus TaxID=427918 RepID=UPI001B80601D|nr:ubiquitin-like small modifier protein 1 [Nitriliruptor alkaliphilus]